MEYEVIDHWLSVIEYKDFPEIPCPHIAKRVSGFQRTSVKKFETQRSGV
ncbi:MAG: hypothetical protein UW95_C0023G0021 [Parcubacteria group bacterium GW2011_GWC1_45_14]|nr:MAG: hypothetical protein UW87_C0012G0003 [Candidatus Moranbacteria bacterium GW2011_GWC2_45_10]KKT93425.1 MAG: hypothetical protein UW95_C0023G0021 [Parcubacteria group bacterium GW2011_GWC1_45_14]